MRFWRRPLLLTAAMLAVPAAPGTLGWDWDWFRPLLEKQATEALGRTVRIGRLDVALAPTATITLDDVTISNTLDFPEGSRFASLGRLSLKLDLAALEDRVLRFPEIALERAQVELGRAASGKPNWVLALPASDPAAEPLLKGPEIGRLAISDGTVHVVDPGLKADFALAVHTEAAADDDEPRLVVEAKGRYAGNAITGRFVGGSALMLRDPAKPYPVDLRLAHGATHVRLKGTVERPMEMGGAQLALELSGNDLAELFPLTGIPIAPTPPYHLNGRLDYAEGKIRFDRIAGTVGGSDLGGSVTVDPTGERPLVTADLASRKVALADLAGFIGAAPGKADARNATAKQKLAHAKQEESPRVLPDTPINLPKLRAADLRVTYKGARIEGEASALDDLAASLTVENGKVTLDPVSFGIGKGRITGRIALDGQQDLVHASARIDFRQVDLHRIMQASTSAFDGAGVIGGRASIEGSGNSLAQLLGRGNGELKLFMEGGEMSALLVNLAGLDFGRSVLSYMGLPHKAPIRCMVADFALDKGELQTRTMLFDTTEANVVGTGSVNLRDEAVHYRVTTEPKHFSVGSIAAPIDIDGPLKHPSVKPDAMALGARAGAAAVLGLVLTPLAALIPTIQLGLGEDNDCNQLLHPAPAVRQAAKPAAKPEAKPDAKAPQLEAIFRPGVPTI